MALLDKLKSLLGLDDDTTPRERRDRDTGVTIEREPADEPATESESAVKGIEERGDGPRAGAEDAIEEAEAGSGETARDDAGADTPASVDEAESDAAASDDDGADPAPEATDETGGDVGQPPGGTTPVDSIKGVGPTYAERLEDVGVETVADLAAADPEDLSERVDHPHFTPGRLSGWIEQARARR